MEKLDYNTIEDITINMASYLKLAEAYVQRHINVSEIVHIGLLIDKMQETMQRQIEMFDTARIISEN